MTSVEIANSDPLVVSMAKSRVSSASLKMELIKARSRAPNSPIFAFEGLEDKMIYARWIKRIDPDLTYEPFNCRGKQNVFFLLSVALKDRSGIGDKVYYFVDRDFDDLQGNPANDSVFMTDRYSIENYLVETVVVDDLLQNEFHCHTEPQIRAKIVKCFESALASFIEQIRELNWKIFVGRRSRIKIIGGAPNIDSVCKVGVDSVMITSVPEVTYESTLDETNSNPLRADFDPIDPLGRYRGKYYLTFFTRWLRALISEYADKNSTYFSGLNEKPAIKETEIFSLNSLASRSNMPEGLQEFIAKVAR